MRPFQCTPPHFHSNFHHYAKTMARVAASLTVFLSFLFLFTISYARDIHDPFSESKPATEIHDGPETTRSDSKPQQQDTVSFPLDSIDPIPLTFVSFRPINRHVPQRPLPLPLSLRLGHRRCRHGHRREIPYGNDAIVRSDAAVRDRFDPTNRSGVRLIPTRWVRFRHAEPSFPAMIAHQHHHHHHSQHREEKRGEGWFMKRIRKFSNLFRF